MQHNMSKPIDTINIHTLSRKLPQTKIRGTIIKLIANYMKERKVYTTYKNHTSSQRQFITGVPQGGVHSPTLFSIYTADISPEHQFRSWSTPKNIAITSTHTSTSAAKKYLHKVFVWTKQNNLTLNPDKTSCTLFTPDPSEYKSNLNLKINNAAPPRETHPEVLDLTFDPKFTYSTHMHNISVQAHKPLHSTHRNRIGLTEGDTRGYLQSSHETGSGVFLFDMVVSCILDQH